MEVSAMNKRWKIMFFTVGSLAVLASISAYLVAESAGSTSGVALPAAEAVQQQEQPGADAGVAPAGSVTEAVGEEAPEVDEMMTAQLPAGSESGVVEGQEPALEIQGDAAAAGVASSPALSAASPSIGNNPAAEVPAEFDLFQNHPNPFNPSTTISYALPVDAHVTLEVYDVVGRRVGQLVEGNMSAGYHDATFDASALASGAYFYRLTAKGSDGAVFTQTGKMLFAK